MDGDGARTDCAYTVVGAGGGACTLGGGGGACTTDGGGGGATDAGGGGASVTFSSYTYVTFSRGLLAQIPSR